MSWLSRNDFTAGEFLSHTYLNKLADDIRAWGGDVNAGGHNLANIGVLTIPKNNTADPVVLVHPDSTSATWDSQPLAALKIAGPSTPTSRNFLCGLWIVTDGAAVDKGRGILVQNVGKSDGICIIQEGEDGVGQAIVMQTAADNATGMVISPTRSDQAGLIVRQELSIDPAASGNLITLEANGDVHEMMRVNSTLGSQVGIIFRMTGASALPIVVENSGIKASLDCQGNYTGSQYGVPGGGFFGSSSTWATFRSPTAVGIFLDYGDGGLICRNLDQGYRTDLSITAAGVSIFNLPSHADNAAATGAGLAVGRLYRTATGQVGVVY